MILPSELKRWRQWVIWKSKLGDDQKIPYSPKDGQKYAKCNDSSTWDTYGKAEYARTKFDADGISFCVTDGDPYSVIDMDDCMEGGKLKQYAQDIVNYLASYAEFSPSMQGVHVWTKAKLPPGGRRTEGIEMYDSSRFITMTGKRVPGTPNVIVDAQQKMERLHARMFPVKQSKWTVTTRGKRRTDDEVLSVMLSAKNGKRFREFFYGTKQQALKLYYGNASNADFGLCSALAYWTNGDRNQMDRLFRKSVLLREKWDKRHSADGRTYGQITIQNAIDKTCQKSA
jgi:putative DNA primase/helicase